MSKKDSIKFVLMIERPFVGYALFYAIGTYLALIYNVNMLIIYGLLDVLGIIILIQTLRLKKCRYFIALFSLFVGYLLCSNVIPQWYQNPVTPVDECHITGDVIEVSNYAKYSKYHLTNVTIGNDDIDSDIIITNVSPKNKVEAGDRILTSAELELPAVAQLDGFFNERRYYMTNNIQYTATVFEKRIAIISSSDYTPSITQRINKSIYNNLLKSLNGANLGLVYALSTGEKDYLDDEFYDKCSDLGISHVFAISGLHLGIIIGVFVFITLKIRMRYLLRNLVTIAVVGLMIIVIGNRVSLIRASIMALIILIYNMNGIRKDAINILSITILILLLINPLYIIDTGFILSISSVFAIIVVIGPLNQRFSDKKLLTFYPIAIFLTSTAISLFNFLLLMRYFGHISLLSPIWNIIFIPLITIMVILLLIYSVTFYIPYIGLAIIKVIDLLSSGINKLVNFFHKLNFTISIDTPSIFAVIALMLIVFLMTNYLVKNRQRLRLIVGITLLAALLTFSAIDSDKEEISILAGYDDVFVFIESGNQNAIVINNLDKGALRVAEDLNIKQLDTLIYSGNDMEDYYELIDNLSVLGISDFYLPETLCSDTLGENHHPINELIKIGNVSVVIDEFKANKKAIINYYAIIETDDSSYAYLDTYKLREGALQGEHILICSRWSKARIKNIPYVNTKYVIINSSNYCMDLYNNEAAKSGIAIHNINNNGALCIPIEDN